MHFPYHYTNKIEFNLMNCDFYYYLKAMQRCNELISTEIHKIRDQTFRTDGANVKVYNFQEFFFCNSHLFFKVERNNTENLTKNHSYIDKVIFSKIFYFFRATFFRNLTI